MHVKSAPTSEADSVPASLHVIGSRQMGGADQFYCRLVGALHAARQPVAALTRAGSPIARTLAATPVEQLHLPLANSWDLYSVWRIRRLVRAREFDVVQTYMGRATRLTRLPRKTESTHIARLGGYYKIDGYYRHAHAWVGNTKGLCDYLVQQGLPAARVFQIGNFVPEPISCHAAQLAELRARWSLPEDAVIFFALGRLIGIKGYDDLLNAFARLPARINERTPCLLIAGDGPLRDELHALAHSAGIAERVRWLGWQETPGPYFHLADWVVCTSRYETLGNVILEAWSYRKPVIATAAQGPAELIADNDNGLLAPCADPVALAQRMRDALQAPAGEALRLATSGHAKLTEEFNETAIVGRYLELYGRAASLRSP